MPLKNFANEEKELYLYNLIFAIMATNILNH